MTTIPLLTVAGTLTGFFAIIGTIPRTVSIACTVASGGALVAASAASDRTWQRVAYIAWAVILVGLSVRKLRRDAPSSAR